MPVSKTFAEMYKEEHPTSVGPQLGMKDSVPNLGQARANKYQWGDCFYNELDSSFYMVKFVKIAKVY